MVLVFVAKLFSVAPFEFTANARRQFGALTSAAVLMRNLRAEAANPDVLVPGWDLPANVDPHQVLDVPAQNVAFNLYDNLYRYEDNPPKEIPWLAESMTYTKPDFTELTIKMRPGAEWSDGEPVTAADVVYTFEGQQGKTYQIDLHSKAFDAYLYLRDAKDVTLMTNDDVEPGNLDSRIVYQVTKSGTYKILATSLGAGGTGPFTLTVREVVAPPKK